MSFTALLVKFKVYFDHEKSNIRGHDYAFLNWGAVNERFVTGIFLTVYSTGIQGICISSLNGRKALYNVHEQKTYWAKTQRVWKWTFFIQKNELVLLCFWKYSKYYQSSQSDHRHYHYFRNVEFRVQHFNQNENINTVSNKEMLQNSCRYIIAATGRFYRQSVQVISKIDGSYGRQK